MVVNEDEPYAEIVWSLIELKETNPKVFETILSTTLPMMKKLVKQKLGGGE